MIFVCSFLEGPGKKSPLRANYRPSLAAFTEKGSLTTDLGKEKGPRSTLSLPCFQSEVVFHDGSSVFLFLNWKDPDVGFPSVK